MEENKAQALHDELTLLADKRGKTGGLGLGGGSYSWSATNVTTERTDGLPNNPLYVNFVREGSFVVAKANHGDGRMIKRNFDDCKELSANISSNSSRCSVVSEDIPTKRVKLTKEQKKAAKLEAKRQAKIAEKKAAKLLEKKAKRDIEKMEQKNTLSHLNNQANEISVVDQSSHKLRIEEPKNSNNKIVKKTKKSKSEKPRIDDCEEVTEMTRHRKEINNTPNTIVSRKKKEKKNKEEKIERITVEKQQKKEKKKKKKD
jgi:hypothetical protein